MNTVRQAIKSLVNQGIVTTRRRSGAYVSQEIIDGQKTVAVISGHHRLDNIKSPWHLMVYRELCRALERVGWSVRSYTVFHGTPDLDHRSMNTMIQDAQPANFPGSSVFWNFGFFSRVFSRCGRAPDPVFEFRCGLGDQRHISRFSCPWPVRSGAFVRPGGSPRGVDGNSLAPSGYFGFIQAVHKHPAMETREEWIRCPNPSIKAGFRHLMRSGP